MNEWTPAQLKAFDALDEAPSYRLVGGSINSIDGRKPGWKKQAEYRSRERFPKLERVRAHLNLLSYLLEKEEQ